MKFARPVVGLMAVAAATALAIPSQAARSKTLFFDTQRADGTGGCIPTYVLTPGSPSGDACGAETFGYQGKQTPSNVFGDPTEVYNMLPRSVKGLLDTRRHLTGTVYVSTTPPVGFAIGPAASPDSQGGPIGADITFTVNGVTVGKASGSNVVAPNSSLAIPVNLALPKKLSGKAVKSIVASVHFTGGMGVVIVNNAGSSQSKIVVPTR